LIGLSLLPTGHPPSFQPRWVRPSTGSYPRFSLPMGSSPGFASAQRDSLPSRGAFHLSLAVLVRYRSQESIQGWRVDPPDSHRVSRARRYSGADCRGDPIRVRGSNPVPPAFPGRSASVRLCNRTIVGPTTPGGTCPPRFALGPLSLATTRGISI